MNKLATLCCIGALLTGCGGSGTPPFPVESGYDTAVIQSGNVVCTTTYTVHRDASAQKSDTCGSGTKTVTLPAALVSGLFQDLQEAQPLGALSPCLTVDTPLTVGWNGELSPNLSGSCPTGNSAELALTQQIGQIITAFEPVP